MPENKPQPDALLAGISAEGAQLAEELRGLMRARWKLLQLELTESGRQLRAFTVVSAVAAIAALVSLPVLIVAAADALDGRLGWPRWAWLLASGTVLLASAGAAAALAYRRLRRDFTGVTESLEELREDLAWLEEFRGRRESP